MTDPGLPVRMQAALCINNIVEADSCDASVILQVPP